MTQLIDVTTTAVLRPELVDQTFRSFKEHLFHDLPVRLILNVDRIGSETATVEDVLHVAERHFPMVTLLTPQEKPNQNLALKRVWEAVETDLFFNLEDDWEMIADLDLLDMIAIMRGNPKLATLRFPQRASGADRVKVYRVCKPKHYYRWNGRYFTWPEGSDIVGHFAGIPSIVRTSWMRPVLSLIRPDLNVERMLRDMARRGEEPMVGWEYGCYTKPNTPVTVIERGKEWHKKTGWFPNDRRNPTAWVRRQ